MKCLNKYPPVVIAGLNDAAVSLVRSLGQKGIQVIGLYDDNAHSYYKNSKYISQKIQSPLYGQGLRDTLIQKVSKMLNEPAVLFCTNDHSVLTVSQYSAELTKLFKFVLPSYDMVCNQINKREFSKFALENSFLIPKTVFLDASSDIEPIMQNISFPCIIKPEFRDQKWNENISVKVLYAKSKEDFRNLIDKYYLKQFSLIIQEWIEGGDSEVYFCLAYLNRTREPLAICTGRKLRQHPHLTGSTSIAETVHLPEVTQESLRLLTTAGCVGFCSVEFKKSSEDGRFYITEPTIGRPDTQEGICVGAGVDIPYIAYLDALEKTPEPAAEVKKYIKWINEPLEFYCFQDQWRNGFRLSQFMSSYKGERSYSLWSPDDPGPMFAFTKEKLSKGIAKLSKHR